MLQREKGRDFFLFICCLFSLLSGAKVKESSGLRAPNARSRIRRSLAIRDGQRETRSTVCACMCLPEERTLLSHRVRITKRHCLVILLRNGLPGEIHLRKAKGQ